MTVLQRSILLLATPAILLMGVSCKQRTMNETASPDSIGATYDGKENFIWPLIKEQVTADAPGSKEVCWYTYQKELTAGSAQSDAAQYTPQQIREFFLKANTVGGDNARYIPLAAFKTEAQGAAQARNLKYIGTAGACTGALFGSVLNSLTKVKAAGAVAGLFCIGALGRQILKNPRNDDTKQDVRVARNFNSFSANSFLEDVRIPPLEHKALLKTIEKTLAADVKNPKDKAGEVCPMAPDALALVDATMRAMFDAQSAPSAIP
jgi:hypothetical protein